ncbi:hypothetical protein ACJJTC_007883 [Scirpophaga incertulas]
MLKEWRPEYFSYMRIVFLILVLHTPSLRSMKMVEEMSLMELVIATAGVLLSMLLLFSLCCLCMKLSDLKLKFHIMRIAKKKGIEIDEDMLEPKNKSHSPQANENCTIMVPDIIWVDPWVDMLSSSLEDGWSN